MKEPGVEILPAVLPSDFPVPAIIASAGGKASEHFLEFFAATIRNKNTRAAYVQAAAQFFRWCEQYNLKVGAIRPLHVSAYIESKSLTAPSIKQHLAALRGLFNWLVIRQVVPENPAMFVKGPRFSRKIGVTPIMEAKEVRLLLDSIPVTRRIRIPRKHGGGHKEVADIKGLRDRAAIAVMGYTFARVSAVIGLTRADYRLEGKRARLRLLEKGIRNCWSGCITKRKSTWTPISRLRESKTEMRPCSSRSTRRISLPAKPSAGVTCCVR